MRKLIIITYLLFGLCRYCASNFTACSSDGDDVLTSSMTTAYFLCATYALYINTSRSTPNAAEGGYN